MDRNPGVTTVQKLFLIVLALALSIGTRGEANTTTVTGPIQRILSRSPTRTALVVRAADAALVFTRQIFARKAGIALPGEAEATLTAFDE